MKTLELIQDRRLQIPMSVTWYLSDIGHAHGLQELFSRQSPQKLKVMREHAIAQSAIEENKARYYETLQQSSQGWHEGKHDPWPYIGYLLYTIKLAYDEFERRAGEVATPKGEKTALVESAINRQTGPFTVSDVRDACPGVGVDLIRKILGRLKGNRVECLGRGQSAQWRRLN